MVCGENFWEQEEVLGVIIISCHKLSAERRDGNSMWWKVIKKIFVRGKNWMMNTCECSFACENDTQIYTIDLSLPLSLLYLILDISLFSNSWILISTSIFGEEAFQFIKHTWRLTSVLRSFNLACAHIRQCLFLTKKNISFLVRNPRIHVWLWSFGN